MKKKTSQKGNQKLDQLEQFVVEDADELLTTDQGVRISDDHNTLKAGSRGPSLLEDFHFREKMTHFDHERIPERVVHARGEAAHGVFKVYESLSKWTSAAFLQDPNVETPVFVRFSTVAGSKGSTDLARDVRGFAVKFYTTEGNFDIVGNNMPVFFIQDAMKFPDFVHAVKPEPHHEMPQAASAHDNFWDFVSLSPESTHMLMWVMSDRAIPRSLRMMEGFGVHTFRLINEKGQARFVKFHWKPLLGVHSVVWDEAVRISGNDPDFHRRDLWEAIENGDFPEWELGMQVIEEKDEFSFDFDILDPTKLIPEEIVPVQRVGRLTLNRNPDNFFAETEQVAYHVGNIVPGIDFTNDPLMQGRLFSYTDTQLLRLGGPNFHEIPINRPIAPVHNNQRDGLMRQTINRSQTAHIPNSVSGGCPFQAGKDMRGFVSYAEKVDAHKIRERSKSFLDHYTQARMFYISMSVPEQNHIVNAFSFELSKVVGQQIRERMLLQLAQVDGDLAKRVAANLGMKAPAKTAKVEPHLNMQIPATANPKDVQSVPCNMDVAPSPVLSMVNAPPTGIATRKVAALAADGVSGAEITKLKGALLKEGAQLKVIGTHAGSLKTAEGEELPVDHAIFSCASVLFDAVYVPGGAASVKALSTDGRAIHFVNEAFKHCKTVGATNEGVQILQQSCFANKLEGAPGVVTGKADISKAFIESMNADRHFERENDPPPPA